MVHISDGILSPEVLAAGWLITIIILTITLRKTTAEEIPKLSVVTAAFFVASLIHFPVGPTSVHLILNGLVGVIMGRLAYISIFIGIVLQAFLFGHGGISVIGVNTLDMGLPALIAYGIFVYGSKFNKLNISLLGGIAGGLGVIFALVLTAIMLITTGEEFTLVAKAFIIFHLPIIIIEAVIVASVLGFLIKVKPEILKLNKN